MPRSPKPAKPVEKVLAVTIEYRVHVENFNADEVLDRLRELGSAEFTNVRLVDGPI